MTICFEVIFTRHNSLNILQQLFNCVDFKSSVFFFSISSEKINAKFVVSNFFLYLLYLHGRSWWKASTLLSVYFQLHKWYDLSFCLCIQDTLSIVIYRKTRHSKWKQNSCSSFLSISRNSSNIFNSDKNHFNFIISLITHANHHYCISKCELNVRSEFQALVHQLFECVFYPNIYTFI